MLIVSISDTISLMMQFLHQNIIIIFIIIKRFADFGPKQTLKSNHKSSIPFSPPMAAGLEWLGLLVVVGFVDKLDEVEGAKAVDRSQCLVEVEGFPVVGTNVIHCHLAMFIIINN